MIRTRMKIYFLYCLLSLHLCSFAQPEQFVQLRFVPKQSSFSPGKNDYQPGKNGFYLYENCMYTLVIDDDKQYNARIISIKKDSIVFTTHFNAAVAKKQKSTFDTLSVSPAAISTIRLIGDRTLGIFHNVAMKKYDYEFISDTMAKKLWIDTIQLYTNMQQQYELLPFLTYQGLDLLYEEDGNTFYFQGRLQKDTAAGVVSKWQKKDDSIFRTKNIAWALPTRANKINGWALGLHTGQIFGRQLTINGLNTSADVPAMFIGMMSSMDILQKVPLGSLSDSADTDWYITKINGLSLSMGGLMRCSNIRGIALNGGICFAYRTRGLVVSGGYNNVHDFKGISICGLRNVSVKGRGIQIALINVCKNFKGLQIGLWNVNSKRKLPVINWGT
jgi:hypothetical protein